MRPDLKKFRHFCHILKAFANWFSKPSFSIGQKFYLTLANLWCCWANFIGVSGQILANNFAIWSHCFWAEIFCSIPHIIINRPILDPFSLFLSFQYRWQLIKIANDWIRTPVLSWWKQQLIQLCHNLCQCDQKICRAGWVACIFYKNGPFPASFIIYFWSFSHKHYNFYNNICEKLSIQYLLPGFEPTTSWAWVSCHNH